MTDRSDVRSSPPAPAPGRGDDPDGGRVHVGGAVRRTRLGAMNPRYRRLVIPGALVALILIVVVSAVLRG